MIKKKITEAIRSTFVFLLAITGYCLQSQPANAQLQIAPVAIYMDDDNTTGRIVIRNSSAEPVEVEIELLFAYPDTDENGNVYLKHVNPVPDHEPSAVEWIRVYPRFFELAPGQRQTVRFAARAPAGLENGEYWARPAVVAQLPTVIDDEAGGAGISTRINMRRRTILSLNYRNGDVQTGAALTNMSADVGNNTVGISADLERRGNAAFLGHSKIRVFDSGGSERFSEKKEIALYHNQNRTFEINTEGFEPGTYRAELELFTSDRTSDGIIQASPESGAMTFTIP